jgi:amino acid permease
MMTNIKYALSFVFGGIYCLSWRTLLTTQFDPNNLWLVIPICVVVIVTIMLVSHIIYFFIEYWDEK